MNRIKHLVIAFIVGLNIVNAQTVWDGTTASDYGGGNGSSEYPYLIFTADQLAKFSSDVSSAANWSEGKYFKLMADIKLNENVLLPNYVLNTAPTFKKWSMIGIYNTDTDYLPFKGIFDGNGHTISGVYISDGSISYAGLFRYVENAVVKNLGIINSYIYGNANAGGIAGIIKNSTVVNCYSTSRVDGSGSYHGGIVGHSINKSVISNCYNLGYVGGKNNCAGILGRHGVTGDRAVVNNCFNFGPIVTSKTNKSGIVAENNATCQVKNCFYLSTQTSTGVYAGTGTATNVLAKTKADFLSASLLKSLNDTSIIISLACRWMLNDSVPVHNYSIATEDLSGKPDMSKVANTPVPANGELHANADNKTINLTWRPAINGRTVRHFVYFSTDSATIANYQTSDTTFCVAKLALSDTTYFASQIYSMDNYYWRVDQKDNSGQINKGNVWHFKPRQLAFPTAEGYGRFANGGRGGVVVHVTNLNDSGEGSFRNAVTGNNGQPRTVVFDVSGIIRLNSRLVMGTNITVAGQTAPGKGICFRGAPIGISSESVCRFVRLRLGGGTTYDGMGMAGANNCILDHSSISWTIDESFSSRYAKNITLQRTLISEALNVAGHQNYPAGTAHGYAGSISGDCGSFHHNLLAHNEGRNWSLAGGLDGNGYYAGRLDIFNMVVYNWGGRATDGGVNQGNFVNNYYKRGPASTQSNMLKADLEGAGKGSQSYYFSGNIEENTNGTLMCDGTDNTCGRTYTVSNGQIVDWTVFVNQPFFPSYASIESAKDAYKSVLSNVGCNMPVFDDHDKRIVNETLNGTYTYTGSYTGKKGLIDNEADAGGYEDYPALVRSGDFDTDKDGLPDWWETMHGTNTASVSGDFSDANADNDKDGFTALEDYLDWMSVPNYFVKVNDKDTIDLSPMLVAYTKNPRLTTVSSGNLSVSYLDKKAIITPATTTPGINFLKFRVTDNEGSVYEQKVGICLIDNTFTSVQGARASGDNFKLFPTIIETCFTISCNVTNSKAIILEISDLTGKKIVRKTFALNEGENLLPVNNLTTLSSQMLVAKIFSSETNHLLYTQLLIKK